jgi:hypothetical protein
MGRTGGQWSQRLRLSGQSNMVGYLVPLLSCVRVCETRGGVTFGLSGTLWDALGEEACHLRAHFTSLSERGSAERLVAPQKDLSNNCGSIYLYSTPYLSTDRETGLTRTKSDAWQASQASQESPAR